MRSKRQAAGHDGGRLDLAEKEGCKETARRAGGKRQ
jgi:hypothetical protein